MDDKELSKENVFALIRDLKSINCANVYLSGGEPTSHPNFEEIVMEFKRNDISVTLATNGLDTLSHLPVIKEAISSSGVFISIDGIGKTHDQFRGKRGAFDTAINTIKVLKAEGIPVRINTTIWNRNLNEGEKIIELTKELGVDRLSFLMLYDTGRASDNDIFLTKKQYLEAIKYTHRLMELYGADGLRITLRRDEKVSHKDYCPGGSRILHIDCDGVLYPCSWVAKSPLSDEYSVQWEKGKIKKNLADMKDLQKLFNDRKNQGFYGCPAAATTVCSKPFVQDPLTELLGKE